MNGASVMLERYLLSPPTVTERLGLLGLLSPDEKAEKEHDWFWLKKGLNKK